MFVSRAVLTIALNARYSGGENLLRCIPSYLAAMALGLIIADTQVPQRATVSRPRAAPYSATPTSAAVTSPALECVYWAAGPSSAFW